MTKTGDCEDSALLYAGLGTCIGLDVVLVCFPRHMLCTVFPKEGDFIPVELTGYLPFSFSAMDVTLGDWETLE